MEKLPVYAETFLEFFELSTALIYIVLCYHHVHGGKVYQSFAIVIVRGFYPPALHKGTSYGFLTI